MLRFALDLLLQSKSVVADVLNRHGVGISILELSILKCVGCICNFIRPDVARTWPFKDTDAGEPGCHHQLFLVTAATS